MRHQAPRSEAAEATKEADSRKYYHVHVSGHMGAEEVSEVIQAARPKKLIPIHTEHPELFRQLCDAETVTEGGTVEI